MMVLVLVVVVAVNAWFWCWEYPRMSSSERAAERLEGVIW